MGRRSTISRLPAAIRAAADDALRDGATVDEIVAILRGLGANASRSAVGRYAKDARAALERTERAREVSKVLVGRITDDPDGSVGRGVGHLLQSMMFDYVMPTAEGERPAFDPEAFMLMARAAKDLIAAEKTAAERGLKLEEAARKRAISDATKAVESAAKAAGLSRDGVARMKADFLGLVGR